MVGSQKILTVSYGTFSCTLEGFEDSFETMKAIAEYFRDLAAEDRYFGAEPPQPDAEMLARIAEREVARRVEARMEPSGIVLRVGQSLGQSSGQSSGQTPEQTSAPVAEQVMPPTAPADPAPAPAPAESVAAKLQRIRSVVGKGAATPLAPVAEDAAFEDAVEDTPDDTEARIDAAIADAIAAPAVAAPEAEAEAPTHDSVTPVAETDDHDMTDVDHAAPPQTESPAVAASFDAPAAEAPFPAEENFAEDDTAEEDFTTQAFSDESLPEEPAAEEPSTEEASADADRPAEDIATAPPIRARVIRMRKTDFDRVVASGALVAQAEETAAETAMSLPGADLAADLAEADDSDRADAELAELADLDDFIDPSAIDDLARLDAPGPTLSPDAEAELLAELAAVERGIDIDDQPARDDPAVSAAAAPTHPADLDDLAATLAAIEAETAAQPIPDETAERLDQTDAFDDLEPATAAEPTPLQATDDDDIMSGVLRAIEATEPAPALTAEAEHDLQEHPLTEAHDIEPEVALTTDTDKENAFADADPEPEPHATRDDETPADLAPSRSRFADPEADEAALDRLLSQTDAQMSGPDAARRREAIAQLRAAVAATEAARALGDTPAQEPGTEDSFRDDLREAVRPRRPVAGQPDLRGERPRPAPLKLVASQRIDLPSDSASLAPSAMQPIRPRRVTVDRTADEAPAAMPRETAAAMAASGSFTEFADRMGATSLADLLEAAAAYTAFVEGSEDFSRPQILKKVSMLSPETSREDGLRSFGTLLREGRFRRSPRAGRFEVAEDTRFNPDRHAG